MMNIKKIIKENLNSSDTSTQLNKIAFRAHTAGFCKRQIALSKLGIKNFSTDVLGRMKVGTLIHNWLKDIGLNISIDISLKINNDYELYFVGTCDYLDKNNIVYEFKSVSYLSNNNLKQYHLDQLLIYMKALKSRIGCLIYINKQNLECKQHFFEMDNDRIKKIENKVVEVYELLQKMNGNKKLINKFFPKCN